MAHYKVDLHESVTVTEQDGRPENAPGLRRALYLIEHIRKSGGSSELLMINPAAAAALDRIKMAIQAELENGGPLTSTTMGRHGA